MRTAMAKSFRQRAGRVAWATRGDKTTPFTTGSVVTLTWTTPAVCLSERVTSVMQQRPNSRTQGT